jgi:hypothetical protein
MDGGFGGGVSAATVCGFGFDFFLVRSGDGERLSVTCSSVVPAILERTSF